MIKIQKKEQCCGCGACFQSCPKQCITMEEDSEGFQYPIVDRTKCVNCGICETVCPFGEYQQPRNPLKVYAVYNKNEAVRFISSSGGVFSHVAEQIINRGGIVFGVRFDDDWQAVFDYTDTIEGLSVLRGSKYVQANVGHSYQDAERFLKQNRLVLFTGTSCQIAGIRHYLRQDYENLLTLDVVCHGVPSPLVWRRYLEDVTSRHVDAVTSISFREKSTGWKYFSMVISSDNFDFFRSIYKKNIYFRAFMKNLTLRPSCYFCKVKSGSCGSDITIADFWGIEKVFPQLYDNKGISLLLINNSKAYEFINWDGLSVIETDYQTAQIMNQPLRESVCRNPRRKHFFDNIHRFDSISSLLEYELRPTVKQLLEQRFFKYGGCVKRFIKRTLRLQ